MTQTLEKLDELYETGRARQQPSLRRSTGTAVFLAMLGLLCLFGFGLATGASAVASFTVNTQTSSSVSPFTVSTEPIALVLGVLCLALGVLLVTQRWVRPRAFCVAGSALTGAALVLWLLYAHLGLPLGTLVARDVPLAAILTVLVVGLIGVMFGAVLGIAPRFAFSGLFLSIGILALLWCVLMWAQRSTPGLPFSLGGLIAGSVSYATILIFGSLSGTMCERSGVVNIAIEGQFLAGAFCGSLVGSVVSNVAGTGLGFLIGGIAGIAVGALFGLMLAYPALRYGSNQIIVGIVLVGLATGLTNYLNFQFIPYPNLNTGNVAPNLGIPLLDKIPLLGPSLFDQNLFAYVADVLVIAVSFALFRTTWGLRVRAVGEHPKAAETVGINVIRTRYKSVILGGAIAGFGGAYYTLGLAGQFSPGLTGGLGYIALAVMIFGRWRPYRCLAAALLFGSMFVLQTYLGFYSLGISSSLLSALPYVVTIAVVCGLVGRVRPPAADGIPYSRE